MKDILSRIKSRLKYLTPKECKLAELFIANRQFESLKLVTDSALIIANKKVKKGEITDEQSTIIEELNILKVLVDTYCSSIYDESEFECYNTDEIILYE